MAALGLDFIDVVTKDFTGAGGAHDLLRRLPVNRGTARPFAGRGRIVLWTAMFGLSAYLGLQREMPEARPGALRPARACY